MNYNDATRIVNKVHQMMFNLFFADIATFDQPEDDAIHEIKSYLEAKKKASNQKKPTDSIFPESEGKPPKAENSNKQIKENVDEVKNETEQELNKLKTETETDDSNGEKQKIKFPQLTEELKKEFDEYFSELDKHVQGITLIGTEVNEDYATETFLEMLAESIKDYKSAISILIQAIRDNSKSTDHDLQLAYSTLLEITYLKIRPLEDFKAIKYLYLFIFAIKSKVENDCYDNKRFYFDESSSDHLLYQQFLLNQRIVNDNLKRWQGQRIDYGWISAIFKCLSTMYHSYFELVKTVIIHFSKFDFDLDPESDQPFPKIIPDALVYRDYLRRYHRSTNYRFEDESFIDDLSLLSDNDSTKSKINALNFDFIKILGLDNIPSRLAFLDIVVGIDHLKNLQPGIKTDIVLSKFLGAILGADPESVRSHIRRIANDSSEKSVKHKIWEKMQEYQSFINRKN